MKNAAVLRRIRMTNHVEVDTEGSWAISYGDMITLLLSFFIIFFSTDKEKDRMNAMEASLIVALGPDKEVTARTPQSQGSDPQFDEMIKNKLAAEVHKVGNRLIVEFPNISFFNFGEIGLTKQGEEQLKQFTKRFMPYAGNYLIGIRAFTDHKKVLGGPGRRYADNLELSALRSVATMRVLQGLGVPLTRMRIGGYGELKVTAKEIQGPATTDDAHLRALARKVALVIEPEPRTER